MHAEKTCPKCSQPMLRGFAPDSTRGHVAVSSWVAGEPEKSFWTGTHVQSSSRIPIAIFRCEGCGFLESYASPEFGQK